MGGFATYDKGGGVPGTVVYADNIDFTGTGRTNTITTNGQLLIGATTANAGGNHINVGHITSPNGTITVGYNSPNITIDLAGGSTAVEHLTGNTGGQLNPDGSNNFNLLGTGSITNAGSGSTITTQLTGLTNHNVLIGAGTATITKVAPSATSGVALISQGAAVDPTFGTVVVAGGGTGAVTLTGVITGNGTSAVTASTVTQHGVLVGGASNAVGSTAVGSTGQVLQANTGADPTYSTATYPSTSGTTGNVLTSNGTNFVSQSLPFPVGVNNLGISYSASTFSITGASASLSSSNPAYVTLPSKTAGQIVTIQVTADQTFVDDSGSSTIVGNLFGFGAGDTAASNDIPFFIYAVINDSSNAISFMISRQAGRRVSPVSGSIGKTGSAVADQDFAFFALDNPTVTDYDSNPCLCIGSFRMRLTTSGGDWTVQALTSKTGIGQFQEDAIFDMPLGVKGAAASTHWTANGGTAPILNGTVYQYTVNPNGYIDANYQCTTASTNGVGAVTAQLIIPMPPIYSATNSIISWGRLNALNLNQIVGVSANNLNTVSYTFVNDTSTGIIQNVNLNGNLTQAQMSFRYFPITS